MPGPDRTWVVGLPAEGVDHRRQEQGRIGDPAGDHHHRAVGERPGDRLGAEIGLGRHDLTLEVVDRATGLQDRPGQPADPVGDQVAGDRGDRPVGRPVLRQQRLDPARRGERGDPALVGDDPGAAPDAVGQHRVHPGVEVGVVGGESRIAPGPHLRRRHGRLGHRLETQEVEIALGGVAFGRRDPITPPGRAGTDPKGHLLGVSLSRPE